MTTDDPSSSELNRELASFRDLWRGGFHTGDPLEPVGRSGLGAIGFMSVHHAIYLCCIKPYVDAGTTVLEIGPGRGAWTRTFLEAREVWCLDALSAEHNGFWGHIGHHDHVRYIQVEDFECTDLPDDHFDYLFTFDTLCHVSFEGITAYMTNLRPKLKRGAHCFAMVADFEKYNDAYDRMSELSIYSTLFPRRRSLAWMKPWFERYVSRRLAKERRPLDEVDQPTKTGGWYDATTERTCAMLTDLGYTVVDRDVGACHRDPIIHFVRT